MQDLAPLPIDPLIPAIAAALRERRAAVVVAPPGAGKTTRIPPALLEAVGAPHDQVLVLQPRRVAARAAAARIARERGWRLGEEVGHQIRFENRCGPRTRLRVLTEGILTRRLEGDPGLNGVGCVVLDEFHERSIHTDLALAMLREIQQALRPDLAILVMSATMDPRPVSDFLGAAPIIESPGRLHPVAIEFLERPARRPAWEEAAVAARQALAAGGDAAGHTLVFLPGIGEIRRAEALLAGVDAELHVLHSSVSSADQDRALRPTARRKLILATNIAETSLTIDGVRTVIDSGLARVPLSDPRLGIDRLELRRISRASADQRAGRAGRTAPGRCLRLWTRAEDAALAAADLPEIKRVDLAATVLSLLAYGARPDRFGWFEPPRPDALAQATALLAMLGAIDAGGRLTETGRRLARLPLHPRIGRMLLAGADCGRLDEAAALAALLSERDVLTSPGPARRRSAGHEGQSDVVERLERLGAGDPGIDPQAAANIRRVAAELAEAVRHTARPHRAKHHAGDADLLRLPLYGWPDRVTVRRANDPARGVMVGGRGVVLEPASVVRRAPLFLSIDPRDPESVRPGAPCESRVSLASAIEPEWLDESLPHLVERRTDCHFDAERGRVMGLRRTLFAGLVVREEAVGAEPGAAASAVLYEHMRRDLTAAFQFEPAARWLARAALLRRHMPELNLAALDDNALDEVLREACEKQTSPAGAQARLVAIIEGRLDHKQRRALAEHAPETVAIPSGRRVKLDYPEGGPPILAVKLQDLFGLAQGPRVAAGRVAVLLHLLAPNGRPVQITSDLASFWKTGYAEVRKTLRARYPRHPWPENPK